MEQEALDDSFNLSIQVMAVLDPTALVDIGGEVVVEEEAIGEEMEIVDEFVAPTLSEGEQQEQEIAFDGTIYYGEGYVAYVPADAPQAIHSAYADQDFFTLGNVYYFMDENNVFDIALYQQAMSYQQEPTL